MSTLALPNTIANLQALDASKVQQNFDAVVANDVNLIKRDGTTTMTAALSLVAVDPTLADHAARKSYVDAGIAAEAALRVTGDAVAPPRHGYSSGGTFATTTSYVVITTGATETVDTDTYATAPSPSVTIPAGRAGFYVVGFNGSQGANSPTLKVTVNGVIVAVFLSSQSAAGGSWCGFLAVGATVTFSVAANVADTLTYTVSLAQLSV